MVEIRYKNHYELADLTEQTVSEAREQFKAEFGIPNKAAACLNGKKIKEYSEPDTVLSDDDKLSFTVTNRRGIFLIGTIILALIITGSTFAFGFTNASTSITTTTFSSNFADVSTNPDISNISWRVLGSYKGTIGGPHGIFNIVPSTGYTGDLIVTVSLANVDQLAKDYRTLALRIGMVKSSDNSTVDINESGFADRNDWTLLTLDNPSATMSVLGGANMTIKLLGGYYISNAVPNLGWSGSTSPDLYCEVTQGGVTSITPLVAGEVSFYTLNFNNAPFTRSLNPMNMTAGSASASQSVNPDGSVSLNINNSPGYADSGFYLYTGTLGNLNNVLIKSSNGSGPFSVNIWFDRDNDGETFTWNNNVYQGVDNDAYILGPSSQNGTHTINSGSQFNSLIPGGGNYTLAQLKSGVAPGINSNTQIAIWVGIAVNSGSQNATIQSMSIS